MSRPIPARIALGGGIVGLVLTVINQGSGLAQQGPMAPALERAGVLASLLAVVLMLVGLLWERIEPVPPDRVALEGREGLELADGLPDALQRELGWGSQMLLTATPAATVLVLWRERVVLRRGLLAEGAFRPGPICRRAQEGLGGVPAHALALIDLETRHAFVGAAVEVLHLGYAAFGRGIGKGIREFNAAKNNIETEIKEGIREDERKEKIKIDEKKEA